MLSLPRLPCSNVSYRTYHNANENETEVRNEKDQSPNPSKEKKEKTSQPSAQFVNLSVSSQQCSCLSSTPEGI